MTPMVDLGFLLITFFVFTAAISRPSTTNLYMPKDEVIVPPPLLSEELALTFLLAGDNRVFYYEGGWDDAVRNKVIFETNFLYRTGIGEIIRQKQKIIDASGKFPDGRNGLMLLIKPSNRASYRNLIDALDEVLINEVRKYAILDPQNEEEIYLEQKKYLRD